jgi:3-oxoacyl-[acyl-carrier protein] reductase
VSRVVLVTGGSRGIGLACARRFQDGGDRVAVTFKTAPPADLAGGAGSEPLWPVACDVDDPAAVEAAFSAVETGLGPVEVLVCSAGVTDDGLVLRMSEERWSRVIETDLSATFRAAKRALGPMLRARSGRIILISSVVAYLGNAGQANYAAAKAGQIGFARSLAREVAGRSITVNVVAPGLVATDMLAAVSEQQRAALLSLVPLGRVAEPDEVAGAVHFLASNEAAYITGAVLAVDGGLGMGH